MEHKQIQDALIEAVGKSHCTILKGATQCELPARSNSVVRYSLWSITRKVLEAAVPVFNKVYSLESSIARAYPGLKGTNFVSSELAHLGSNFVHILGDAPEPMHIHATTVVVQIVQGKGVLIHPPPNSAVAIREVAEEGDTIVIPVGAPHFFHGNPVITYTGIEFGPVLDYQKHHLL